MTLDIPTLMLASAFVSALCGGFLLSFWWQHREPAALWWAAGSFSGGGAVALLAAAFANKLIPLFLGGLTLLIVAPALTWSGLRCFNGERACFGLIAAAFLTWLAALASQGLHGPEWAPTVVNSTLIAALSAAAIGELGRHGGETLRARVPLTGLIALNGGVFLLAVPAVVTGGIGRLQPPPLASLFGLIHFEGIVYVVGTTVFLVAMVKERSEQRNLREAQTDVLTGLANRRAFLPLAERVADRCQRQGEPYAVVVFDLDRFKRVNDTFGHPFGDEVLRVFADVVRAALRPGDLVSRVGGEEFFAILPGANLKEGCGTARRVCRAFEAAGATIDGCKVGATVSAGVMASDDASVPLAKLLERADAALYRAKLNGRNCVQCGLEEPDEKPYPRLVRVA
jgi:diguanylate cyclase (GGDEF)-like protein